MNKNFLQSLRLTLAVMDILCINAIFFICQVIYGASSSLNSQGLSYSNFGLALNIAWLIPVIVLNIYQEKFVLSFEKFTKISVHAYAYFLLIIGAYFFIFTARNKSENFAAAVVLSILGTLVVNRIIYLAVYHYFKSRDRLINKVLVIGYNQLSVKLVSYLESQGINKQIIGYCDERQNINELTNYPILSTIDKALNVCKENGVTEIYSTIAPEHNEGIYNLIHGADQNCIRVKIVPDLGFFVNRQMHMDFINEIPVLTMRKEPLEDLGNRIKKRLFDIAVSLFVIVFILSWLIPIIGILILIESRGNIFFKQERSGKDNKKFNCLKFRSMQVNPDANKVQATKNDARITKIGKFLRRTSLDEFPQFLNVLSGQMSIVGPRPHMLKHTDEYSKQIGHYMIRQFLKPGITGWAQVNGYRGETQNLSQMQGRVEYDIWYMENWSIWLDLKIIFLTVFNTLRGEENAY